MPAFLLLFTLISALSACFGSHGTDDGGSGVPFDGGVGTDSGPITPPPPPPPLSCPERDIDVVCVDHIVADRPYALAVSIGGEGCFCGETIECHAVVSSEDNVIELTTGFCGDSGLLCDGCFPFIEGTCDLPPLENGRWTVLVNGLPGFELSVHSPDLLPERAPACIRVADDGGGCLHDWPPSTSSTFSSVCHPDFSYPDVRIPIDVADPCGGCGQLAGPCEVQLLDDTLYVRPSTVYTGCDIACPEICGLREDRCWSPPLPVGNYRVVVDGIDGLETTLAVGTPREPVEPSIVCAGVVMAGTATPTPAP